RESRELRDPALEIVGGDREFVTLHELDDTAALEIDRRNQHKFLRSLQANGNLPLSKKFLQLANASLVEVKDRRSERCVGVSGAEHFSEVFEGSGAAGGDHRDVDGIG